MIVHLFAFLGGVGLFLYGMELLGGGLQQAAGARLQKVLQSLTGVPVMGVLLGALVAATLQSSAATTVMSVGLVNAGVMTLKQAFSVVMGANIGTTFTAQLIAFKLTDYFPAGLRPADAGYEGAQRRGVPPAKQSGVCRVRFPFCR